MASFEDRGLTATGYLAPSQPQIRQEITDAIQAIRGPSFDMSDGSLVGQWAGVFSVRESTLWQLGQAIDSSQDPDKATDAAQDAIASLTGTFRSPASSSQVTEALTGDAGTVVAQGTIIATVSTGATFVTTAPATLLSLFGWGTGISYTLGQRVTNGGNVYQCTFAGLSAPSGTGPLTTVPGATISDNFAAWVWLGTGGAAIDVIMLSSEQDAIVANAYDLSAIRTPTSGLRGAANPVAAALGSPQQSNESLRVTRENELAAQGTGPADAIRAAVLKVSGVTSCQVFMNLTDVTDGNGQQPHSVQVVVEGGDDTAIATVIIGQVVAGIPTVGTTTINIADSQGISQPIKFTRVVLVPIYVDATYTYNPAPTTKGGYSTTSGDALAKTAISSFGNGLLGGRDVVASSLSASVFPVFVNGVQVAGVQGVLDVTSVKIGIAPAPTLSTTITITPFQRATFSPTNVTIHSSPGVV